MSSKPTKYFQPKYGTEFFSVDFEKQKKCGNNKRNIIHNETQSVLTLHSKLFQI